MKKYSNHLAGEESPYLQQHAGNPVEWYPWSEEAFERAKNEDKPILVSIGYATCHWCHVMEKESFEDENIAAIMNDLFINIKVDREERPDVDHFFMEAVHHLGMQGGWPLNVFLTPDRKPFFGGTYYPPEPRYNRPSWPQVLMRMHKAFLERRGEVEEQADRLAKLVEGAAGQIRDKFAPEANDSGDLDWKAFLETIKETFDRKEGGFGGAPKFPQVYTMMWLMAYGSLEGDAEALDHVRFTLGKMLTGGIYDAAGGGFARYAVDRVWKIPHFEKMLYDNALLLNALGQMQLISPHPLFGKGMEETVGFLLREMKQEGGGYSSAIDADSDGLEGKFYVWSWRQLMQVLTPEEMTQLAKYMDISLEGNWEDTNILYYNISEKESVDEQLDSWYDAGIQVRPMLDRLLMARAGRNRPITDTKVITGWNAMLACGLFSAGVSMEREDWLSEAVDLVQYLDEHHRDEGGGLLRLPSSARRVIPAFLEDEAWLIRAFLQAAQIFPEAGCHQRVDAEIEAVINAYYDPDKALFYENRVKGEAGDIPRVQQLYDTGLPSANAVMVLNLQEASILLNKPEWGDIAKRMLTSMTGVIGRFPASFPFWAMGMMAEQSGYDEWAVIGPDYKGKTMEVLRKYRPFRVVDGSDTINGERPLLMGKGVAAETLLYFCTGYSCRAPVHHVSEITNL